MQPTGPTKLVEERINAYSKQYQNTNTLKSTENSNLNYIINFIRSRPNLLFFSAASVGLGVCFAGTLIAIGIGALNLSPLASMAILVATAASSLFCAHRAFTEKLWHFHEEERLMYG